MFSSDNKVSQLFFGGRCSLDKLSTTVGDWNNKFDANKFQSQSSQQTVQQSSLDSSNSVTSKLYSSRFDDALSIKRHNEIMETFRNIDRKMTALSTKIDSLETKFAQIAGELHSSLDDKHEKTLDAIGGIESAISSDKFIVDSHDKNVADDLLGATKDTSIQNLDSLFTSESEEEGMCLSQYMLCRSSKRNQPNGQVVQHHKRKMVKTSFTVLGSAVSSLISDEAASTEDEDHDDYLTQPLLFVQC